MVSDRGQMFTFEAAMSILMLALVMVFIVMAIPLTPLTSSAANVMVENQLEKYGADILNVMCHKKPDEEYSPLKAALLYWDGDTMHGGVYDYYGSARLKSFVNQTLDKEGIAYNIEAYYFKKNNGTKIVQSRNFVWNGYPSDNAVTVSKTVPLYDSDYGQQGIKTLTYNVDGNTTNLYNLIEVRLTLWRM
ncbi:MAG: hypothetical protein ACLFO6_05415 [Archaeoglobaceae archaeon]